MRSVALLRGVNVGGRRKIAMAALSTWLGDAGFASVTTYIQSGNVILEHPRSLDVGPTVRRVIAERTGWDVPVLVRSALELRRVVAGNPYTDAAPTQLHVSFLNDVPDATLVERATAVDWAPEGFTITGRSVYLHLPQGMGRSAMVPRLALLTNATTRNWNTVLALNDLASRAGRR